MKLLKRFQYTHFSYFSYFLKIKKTYFSYFSHLPVLVWLPGVTKRTKSNVLRELIRKLKINKKPS
jgi:hypothetical protein